MKWSTALLVATIGTSAVAPCAAMAAPSAIPPLTQGRLEDLGRFVGDRAFCEKLGYTPINSGGGAFAHEIAAIAERVGVAPSDAEAAVDAAKKREAADLSLAFEQVQAHVKEASQDKALRAFSDTLAVRCDNAANDPVASLLMKAPPGEVSDLSLKFADGLLAPYGRASWQSPYLLAGGDLAEAVGACETHLARGQGRAYLAELRDPTRFAPELNDTVQAWLDQKVSAGRKSAGKAALSAAQCRTRLAKQRAAFEKAPVD